MTDLDQIHDKPGTNQEENINEPALGASAEQLAEDIYAEERAKNEGPYRQPAEPRHGLPQSKSAEVATSGDEEAPESDRARIERLGRERPARFKSFGAELAFCYSVIASQFMSVRFVPTKFLKEF